MIPQGTGERFIAFRDDPYAEDAARLIPTHKTSIGNDFHIYATDSAIGSNNFLYGSNDSTVVIGQRITNSGNAKEFIGNITLQSSEASIICWRVVGSDTRLTASDSVTGSRFNLTGLNSNTIVQGQKINIVGQGQNVGTDISVNGGSNNIGLRSVTNGIGAAAIFSGTSGAHALLVDAGNVGIGTSVPSSLFSVGQNNQFQVDFSGDIKRINNVPYSFPSNQGSNGQALLNDGAGNLTWVHSATGGDLSGALTNATVVKLQGVPVSASVPTNGQVLKYNGTTSQWEPGNPTPNVAYEAGVQAPLTIPQSVVTTIVFGAETFDDGLSYNPATGIFTVPATGRYHFDASVQWQNPTFAIGRFEMQLKVNNALTKNTYTTFNQDFSQALSIDLALNAGDQVKVTVVQNSAGPINLVGGLTASTFSGHQLY